MNFKEKTINSKTEYEGNILNLRVDQVELPDGQQASREIVEHSGGMTIIPLLSDNEIVMVKQYRKAAEEVMLELPAGRLELDEEPASGIRRELVEETGYYPQQLEKLFSFYTTPGYSSELLHIYLGRELEYREKNPDQGEFLQTEIIKLENIMELIQQNKIKDSKTIIGLLYVLRKDI